MSRRLLFICSVCIVISQHSTTRFSGLWFIEADQSRDKKTREELMWKIVGDAKLHKLSGGEFQDDGTRERRSERKKRDE